MQFLKDQGFVIRRVNFGDSDRYLTLFTQHNGKIEVVAKGVRKITSRRASSVELLNLISFQAVKSARNHVLTEVQLLNSYDQLKHELSHIEQVFLMCELINGIMPVGQPHSDVFNLVGRALSNIRKDERTMIYFQAKLLSMLGFWDHNASFRDAAHVRQFTEQVIERKLKSPTIFKI